MRLYFGDKVQGWRLWGLVGKNAGWFLGLSRNQHEQMGGNCGCCGKWVKDAIVPKEWPYTVCESCCKGGQP